MTETPLDRLARRASADPFFLGYRLAEYARVHEVDDLAPRGPDSAAPRRLAAVRLCRAARGGRSSARTCCASRRSLAWTQSRWPRPRSTSRSARVGRRCSRNLPVSSSRPAIGNRRHDAPTASLGGRTRGAVLGCHRRAAALPARPRASARLARPRPHRQAPPPHTHLGHRLSLACGLPFPISQPNRDLHGFLCVHDGIAFILTESCDDKPSSGLRWRELAHFLRDYQEPRRKAITRLGPGILEVFDGRRRPTREERLAGALRGVAVGPHIHLLERDRRGRPTDEATRDAEDAADRLAFELLAPFDAVESRSPPGDRHELTSRLVAEFGLPPIPAAAYAGVLLPEHFPQKFFPRFAKN